MFNSSDSTLSRGRDELCVVELVLTSIGDELCEVKQDRANTCGNFRWSILFFFMKRQSGGLDQPEATEACQTLKP